MPLSEAGERRILATDPHRRAQTKLDGLAFKQVCQQKGLSQSHGDKREQGSVVLASPKMNYNCFRYLEIDLVVLNDVPPRMAIQALKTGKLLFCNDRGALADLQERVVRSYLDF